MVLGRILGAEPSQADVIVGREALKHGLWQEAEKEWGFPVPSTVRSFCRRQGWTDRYLEATDWEEEADTVELLVQIIRNLKVAGVIGEASYRVSPAPASVYHAGSDRSEVEGTLSGPADGAITVGDIFAVAAQFGHDCS